MVFSLKRCITSTLSLVITATTLAQLPDSAVTKAVAAVVRLDPVVITATRQGFDVEDFIRLVQEDESLYEAFHNLRTASYRFTTDMYFYDKMGVTEAEYHSTIDQVSDGRCRETQVIDEDFSDRFVKGRREKYRYHTMELYDRVFLTHGRVCENGGSPPSADAGSDTRLEEHISELKRLIFTPGRRAHIPFIGSKTEIFSEKMLPLYDFHIRSDTVRGIPVYVFSAGVKEDYEDKENKTVFKMLITYFSKSDFQVVGRRYQLSQNTVPYMFDVEMTVDLARVEDKYFPARVRYDGTWNVVMKRKETGMFEVMLEGFE